MITLLLSDGTPESVQCEHMYVGGFIRYGDLNHFTSPLQSLSHLLRNSAFIGGYQQVFPIAIAISVTN